MASFFKKKRRASRGPSKNERRANRTLDAERKAEMAGVLGQRFPSVNRLSLRLDFRTPENVFLDQETRVFGPSDRLNFSAPCPGRCGGQGSFDLEGKIRQVLSSGEQMSDSSGRCQAGLVGNSAAVCGVVFQCRIEAEYVSGN